jgi:hypothetical protein
MSGPLARLHRVAWRSAADVGYWLGYLLLFGIAGAISLVLGWWWAGIALLVLAVAFGALTYASARALMDRRWRSGSKAPDDYA